MKYDYDAVLMLVATIICVCVTQEAGWWYGTAAGFAAWMLAPFQRH